MTLRPRTCVMAMALVLATAPAVSGRTPEGIRGVDQRRYVVRFSGDSQSSRPGARAKAWCLSRGAAYRFVDGSLRGQLIVGNRPAPDLEARTTFLQPGPYEARTPIIELHGLEGRPIRWEIAYEVVVGSTQVDERALAAVTWPREWPAGLKPALESNGNFPADDPLIRQAVEDAVDGPIRMTTPYVVAKQIVGYCVTKVRTVSERGRLVPRDLPESDRERRIRRARGPVTWYRLGADHIASQGVGSDQDLVALCVATLRAANVPARVVVGVHEVERIYEDEDGRKRKHERNELVAWGEFYLQTVGWIPFDPAELQSSMRGKPLDVVWPGFGAVKLKDRVPLTYDFALSGRPPKMEISSRGVTSPRGGG